jgi:hypothetical protein
MDLERRSNSGRKRRHFEKLFRICDILALDFDEYEGARIFRVSGLRSLRRLQRYNDRT